MKTLYKIILLTCVFTLINMHSLLAQVPVYYSYDQAGNRTYRGLIKLASFKSTAALDSNNIQKNRDDQQIFQDKLGDKVITIYPNPTQGELQIEMSGYEDVTVSGLYLYTLSGTLLKKLNQITNSLILDLSNYPPGTYLLNIILDDKKFEWTIIKE
jgi:hypothetical protein